METKGGGNRTRRGLVVRLVRGKATKLSLFGSLYVWISWWRVGCVKVGLYHPWSKHNLYNWLHMRVYNNRSMYNNLHLLKCESLQYLIDCAWFPLIYSFLDDHIIYFSRILQSVEKYTVLCSPPWTNNIMLQQVNLFHAIPFSFSKNRLFRRLLTLF